MIRILLFAGLAEAAGSRELHYPAEEAVAVRELKTWFAAQYPSAADVLAISFAAVNQAYADDDTLVSSADEVAFIPPVSGG
ncbi:molybdopterin converting factor subunit 1 [Paenibacillus turpanensis]|uniref:molybdopterin converting factor subunit 1 n=1 Tax=Paenibacillus turpanensis TaxID=2689078 RepID=UPI00140D2D68|nr:molybdopterin converting factor subunit 1 [Paenibacillus turpanensis]